MKNANFRGVGISLFFHPVNSHFTPSEFPDTVNYAVRFLIHKSATSPETE